MNHAGTEIEMIMTILALLWLKMVVRYSRRDRYRFKIRGTVTGRKEF